MPRFAANLSTLFNEVAFPKRFAAAAAAGFTGADIPFPYDSAPAELAGHLEANGLSQVLFNLPPGDWDAGDRGLAALPVRGSEFAATVEPALDYAAALGCTQVHALAGIIPGGTAHPDDQRTYIANLRKAARAVPPHGVTVLSSRLMRPTYQATS